MFSCLAYELTLDKSLHLFPLYPVEERLGIVQPPLCFNKLKLHVLTNSACHNNFFFIRIQVFKEKIGSKDEMRVRGKRWQGVTVKE